MSDRLALLLLGLPIATMSVVFAAGGDRAALADAHQSAPLILEDFPETLDPRRVRTEADQDRIEAIALFSAGRMLELKEQYAEALRHYQRALRRDPKAVSVSRVIVPLAYGLNRHAEAARYALKAEEVHPPLLLSLASHLLRNGDYVQAVELFQKAIASRRGEKETAADINQWLSLGRLQHLIAEYDKAAQSFSHVVHAMENPDEYGIDEKQAERLLGEPGAALDLFGESFLRAGRFDKAAAAFKKAHQFEPDEALLQFNLARVHARRNQPDEALAGLQTCFKKRLTGKGTAPYELLAEVLRDLGKHDELLQRLKELHDDSPDNVSLAYFLAEKYLEADELAKAESLFQALIEKAPAFSGYQNLIEIYRRTDRSEALLEVLGEAVEKAGLLETFGVEAVAGDVDLMDSLVGIARKKIEADPKNLDYGMCTAVALLALESERFDTAGEFFAAAQKADPDRAAKLSLLWGVGLLMEDRPGEAAAVFRRALDEKAWQADDPTFYYYYATALAMDERTDDALAAVKQAVDGAREAALEAAKEADDAREALVGAGSSATISTAERALAAEVSAARLKGDWARFSSRAGWVLYLAKRHDEAAEAYTRLLDEFDDDHGSPEVREVLREVRLSLANIHVIEEEPQRAEDRLEQVLDEFPDDVGASNDLGYLWADRNRHLNRALRMIRHAVDAEPDNVAYRDSLGWVLYRLGRYDEAVVELEKAVARQTPQGEEPDPIILDHLGDAYRKAGRPEKALDAWRRAVEAFEGQEEPDKARAVDKKIKNHQAD